MTGKPGLLLEGLLKELRVAKRDLRLAQRRIDEVRQQIERLQSGAGEVKS